MIATNNYKSFIFSKNDFIDDKSKKIFQKEKLR